MLQHQRGTVRLLSQRSQLDKLPPPLRKAFAEEAVVYSALLDHSTGFKVDFPYRGLTLPARAFVEKAARVNQALSQRLRIVRILGDDLKLADRSRFRRQRDRRFQGRSAAPLEKQENCSTDTHHDDCRPSKRSRHAVTLLYKVICTTQNLC